MYITFSVRRIYYKIQITCFFNDCLVFFTILHNRTEQIEDQTAHPVQSDLDLHCTPKAVSKQYQRCKSIRKFSKGCCQICLRQNYLRRHGVSMLIYEYR